MRHVTIIALVLASTAIACEDKPSGGAATATTTTANAAAVTGQTTASEPAKPKPTMTEMQASSNKLAVESTNLHDAAKNATRYATDAVLKVWGTPDLTGRDAITADTNKLFAGFPDFKIGLSRVWQKGNTEVVEWVVTGTQKGDWMGQKATSRPVGLNGASVMVFNDDGLIKEEHRYFDMTTVSSQLDAKAKAGTFRPVAAALPTSTETHVAKDDPATLAKANLGYAALNAHKIDDLIALSTDDYTMEDYSQVATIKGKKGLKDWFTGIVTAFPDVQANNTMQFAADGYSVSEGVVTGTQKGAMGPIKASNKPATSHFLDIHLLKDGKFVSTVSYSNNVEVLAAIGAIPPPASAPATGAGAATAAPAPTAPAPTAPAAH